MLLCDIMQILVSHKNGGNIMEDDIKQARKIGGSTILPLTGFIEDRKYYKVSRIDNTTIIIKEAKIVVD